MIRDRRSIPLGLWLSVAAAAAACAPMISSRVAPTGPQLPAKATDATVAVFFGAAPPWPYTELGQIRVESRATLPEVVAEAQARARSLGADAIIIDLRYHYQSLPVTFDADGTPHVPDTPRLNANAIAVAYVGAGIR